MMPLACVLTLAAALGGAACANAQSAQPPPPVSAGSDPKQVVATVGDKAITMADVEARWQLDDPAERARVTQLLYQHRRQSIDQIVGDTLIDAAAQKAGLSRDKYLEEQLTKRRGPISEADIKQVYEDNKDRVGASTLEDLRQSITTFITRNRDTQNLAALIGELKAAGPPVTVSLDPPRYEVPILDHDPTRGPADAPVTLIEFSEYQCPFCARVNPTLKQLEQKYGNKVRFVFKDFPLPNHQQAPKAAEAAHCAGDQGKYWELHDVLFNKQQELQPDDLKRHALELGLNTAAFNECLDTSKYGERVRDGVSAGSLLGVNSTPTIFINGRRLSGAQPYEVFVSVIDEELARDANR